MPYKGLSEDAVSIFKREHCDENVAIAELLAQHFASSVRSPILDVGAGLGDISAKAFPEMSVILLDQLTYHTPTLGTHKRITDDFFNFARTNATRYDTILLSHVLQYLDEDLRALNKAVSTLSPRMIVIVSNENDDFLGEIIEWARTNLRASVNPEIHLNGFPMGYIRQKSIEFIAGFGATSFEELGEQVEYLLDTELTSSEREKLLSYLASNLSIPRFTIHQSIASYLRENNV